MRGFYLIATLTSLCVYECQNIFATDIGTWHDYSFC